MLLNKENVRTIDRTGGTFLHTSRTNASSVKADEVPEYVRAEDRIPTDKGTIDCTRHILRVIEFLKLDAIIPIGGDDTLSFAARLHKEGVQIVAIPKTMDNDVFGTDFLHRLLDGGHAFRRYHPRFCVLPWAHMSA